MAPSAPPCDSPHCKALDSFLINLLNGLSAGLLLFMLSAGLTLIFSIMGVLNFAHASFYMLGAYAAYALSGVLGFWPALLLAPLGVGLAGAAFERLALRRVHRSGPMPALLITFGLSYVLQELVQLIWGRAALVFPPPEALQGAALTLVRDATDQLSLLPGEAPAALCAQAICTSFPRTRAFAMLLALLMLALLWGLLARSRLGLVMRAAQTHPEMVEALGHRLPALMTLLFGSGCALAALAGVVGGVSFVTEPAMALAVGPMVFVVIVVGGVGSLSGAFVAALLIGMLQTLPLALNGTLADGLELLGLSMNASGPAAALWRLSPAQIAPLLPYLLMVLILIFRPQGLMGERED